MNKKLLTISMVMMLAGLVLWVGGCDDEASAKSCGSGCTKACCVAEGAAQEAAGNCCGTDPAKCCGADAAKKVEEAAKSCAPGCTKACCADKESTEVKACPPDCTKPCCADK